MNDWFTRRQAVVDAIVSLGVASFAWFWFAEVLGVAGCLGLVLALFGGAQLVRFVGAQLATLEWARMQEAGLPEKPIEAVVPRGAGYRDAAIVEQVPSPDATRDETELLRRRSGAHRSLGIVGAGAALTTLVPGFAFGAWIVPFMFGTLAFLFALFLVIMRGTRRRQAQLADDELARQRVALEPPKVRVGVDFGVPPAQLTEDEDLLHSAPAGVNVWPRGRGSSGG